MIYTVTLPPETKEKLGELVHLQMAFLEYAASTSTPEQQGLVKHLKDVGYDSNHAERVVETFCRTSGGRNVSIGWEKLESFATNEDGTEFLASRAQLRAEKQLIVESMKSDVELLFNDSPNTDFTFFMPNVPEQLPTYLTATKAFLADKKRMLKFPQWLIAVSSFLISYYEQLGDSIPKGYFGNNNSYNRQHLLDAYSLCNPGQYVCAICDEHSFRTIYGGHQLSDVEHYFPKSIYPHLACHPYNLLPICGSCNQIHLNKDPLWDTTKYQRRSLTDVFLPYRPGSIHPDTMIVLPDHDDNDQSISFHIAGDSAASVIQSKIQVLQEVYKIPDRWQEKQEEIGDHLWRRIRQFLADDILTADTLDSPEFLQRRLHRLLAYLSEDLGKDPLTFPMLWRLTQMLIDEIDPVVARDPAKKDSAFLQEVRHWITFDQARIDELDAISLKLRTKASEARNHNRQ